MSVCDAVALVALESFSMDATLGPIPFQVLRGDVTHLSSHAATAVVEDHVLVPPCGASLRSFAWVTVHTAAFLF